MTNTGPDLECTWWPDTWFGFNISSCCVEHDLGGSDWGLFLCALDTLPWWLDWVAFTMLIGLATVGIVFRKLFRRNRNAKR